MKTLTAGKRGVNVFRNFDTSVPVSVLNIDTKSFGIGTITIPLLIPNGPFRDFFGGFKFLVLSKSRCCFSTNSVLKINLSLHFDSY